MAEINFHDAQQAYGFLTPQLLRVEAEVYRIRYPSFDYARLVTVNTDGDMWDMGSVFYSGDIAGQAKFLSGAGFDMPFADTSRTQFVQANHFAGIGYEWHLQELQRVARMGGNLGTDKADAARRVAEMFLYGIAIRGNTEKNLTGLINDAGVPVATVPADGTGSATAWTTKSADLMLRDVNLGLNAVINNSGETEIANRLLLPTSRLQLLASTRIGDTNQTILAFLRDNNAYTANTGQALEIVGSRELETAGGSSSKRMVAYNSDRQVVQFHLPGPHQFLPAFQKSSMTWEVGGIMNVGGIEVRRPKGMAYYDGI